MIILLALIAVLGAADVVTTVIGVKRGGTELNPLARPLFRKFGTLPVAVGFKLIFLGAVLCLSWYYPQPVIMGIIAFIQAVIVAYNVVGLTS
jgi:hypothetical protein